MSIFDIAVLAKLTGNFDMSWTDLFVNFVVYPFVGFSVLALIVAFISSKK